MLKPPVKTPCIGVCSTGIGDSVCRGCKRFAHEVIDWNSYTPEQKDIVDRRLGVLLELLDDLAVLLANGGDLDVSLLGMAYLGRFARIEILGDRLRLHR